MPECLHYKILLRESVEISVEDGLLLPTLVTTYTVMMYRVSGFKDAIFVASSSGPTIIVLFITRPFLISTSAPVLGLDPFIWYSQAIEISLVNTDVTTRSITSSGKTDENISNSFTKEDILKL